MALGSTNTLLGQIKNNDKPEWKIINGFGFCVWLVYLIMLYNFDWVSALIIAVMWRTLVGFKQEDIDTERKRLEEK